jgi:glycosyltransferase involved in cell wall biosynthesis
MQGQKKIVYVINVDWFFISHRLPLALEAKRRGYDVSIATTDTGRFKELHDLGFTLYDLKIDRSGTNPFVEFVVIFKLIRILKKIKPEIVHNVTLKMSLYSSIASWFVPLPKVINAISGLGYNFTLERTTFPRKIIVLMMKLAFKRRGFTFIFQNPDDFQLFKKFHFDNGNKFCIIKGAGIDLEKFAFTDRKSGGSINFIMTSRILKDKGISEFIAASKLVYKRYPTSRFTLVGGTDKKNPASYDENELRNELAGTNIIWLGHRNDIFELLRDSDVMVFPSYREGLPKSLLEAASVGLPIISTDTIGCRECVDNGINGFLVPVGNSKLLAKRMIELIENPESIHRMGKASRIKAEKEFSLSMVLSKSFELY